MTLFEALKNSGIQLMDSNTAVLSKDNVEFQICVSTVTNITNICAKTKLSGQDDKARTMDKIDDLNKTPLFPIGTYWFNSDSNELELRMNLLVDRAPTRKCLEDVISMITATMCSAVRFMEVDK